MHTSVDRRESQADKPIMTLLSAGRRGAVCRDGGTFTGRECRSSSATFDCRKDDRHDPPRHEEGARRALSDVGLGGKDAVLTIHDMRSLGIM